MNEKITMYETMLQQCDALLENEHHMISNLANASALLFETLPDINWAGFYLYHDNELILGPFQGRVACMHIAIGKGVCGTCASTYQTQRIANVHDFPGHIACDARSNSEIVLPIIKEDTLFGVLDIDSQDFDRFDETDEFYLIKFVELFVHSLCI